MLLTEHPFPKPRADSTMLMVCLAHFFSSKKFLMIQKIYIREQRRWSWIGIGELRRDGTAVHCTQEGKRTRGKPKTT